MAKSEIIDKLKARIVKKIINNQDIIDAIDSPDASKDGFDGSCITNTPANKESGWQPHLFTFIRYPDVLTETVTWIGLEVNIVGDYNRNKSWKQVEVVVDIFSHVDHMRIDNINNVTANRNDYLSVLIEHEVLNVGYPTELYSNIARLYGEKFVYRDMIFQLQIPSADLCGDE